MSRADISRWSLTRILAAQAERRPLVGLEREASDAVAKRLKREPAGFFVPRDVISHTFAESRGLNGNQVATTARGLNATLASAGGYLIGTDVLTLSMIQLLRAKTLVVALGATTLSELEGNLSIPKQTGETTAYWLSEIGEVPPSQSTFGGISLTPRRLSACVPYSRQLVLQTGNGIEAFLRADLMRTLGTGIDRASINGIGNAEPVGILNSEGVNTVTFGAAATWAKVLDFESALGEDNADFGSLGWLTTPAVRRKWKEAQKVTNQASFLWNEDNTVNGYRAEATKQVPDDRVIFGNWNDLIVADWDGIDVVVDSYSMASVGQVRVIVAIHGDVAVRHPESFCISTDGGAQ